MKIPKLCNNKSRGRAFVLEGRKKIYLGKWGTPETEAAYRRYVHQLTGGAKPRPASANEITIIELVAAFLDAHSSYYMKGGQQTGQLARFKAAAEFPVYYYGETVACEFGPARLIECRKHMEESGRFSRTYINTLVVCLRGVFKWGVERELIPASVLTALQAVSPLKRGRSAAKENKAVQPVPPEVVDATCEHLPPTIAAMVRVQRLTGMRPGEVCAMRAGDVNTTAAVWVYTLRTDKTDYRRAADQKKKIPIGPKAQAVLLPYLIEKEGTPDAFVFSPIDAANERTRELRASRRTPTTKQTRDRDARARRRELKEYYTTDSYGKAIERATRAAGLPHWRPNQLRHLYASEIRAKYGLEAAQVLLGHANANVTQIYAERDYNKAAAIAEKEG